MSDLLPLFPLPNVVLFPNVFLPLHIFEPRYREMVADAVASDRLIGMVLLRPDWQQDYEGRPPVYPIGCSGLITHVERLADGRYNIVLRGIERFRVLQEDHCRSYRRAAVEPLAERGLAPEDRAAIKLQRSKLEELLTATAKEAKEPEVLTRVKEEGEEQAKPEAKAAGEPAAAGKAKKEESASGGKEEKKEAKPKG